MLFSILEAEAASDVRSEKQEVLRTMASILILGAGASCRAEYPTAQELSVPDWDEGIAIFGLPVPQRVVRLEGV